MKDDLISRQAAIDAIKRVIWDKLIAKDAIDVLCNLPAAQPEKKEVAEVQEIYIDEGGMTYPVGQSWYRTATDLKRCEIL